MYICIYLFVYIHILKHICIAKTHSEHTENRNTLVNYQRSFVTWSHSFGYEWLQKTNAKSKIHNSYSTHSQRMCTQETVYTVCMATYIRLLCTHSNFKKRMQNQKFILNTQKIDWYALCQLSALNVVTNDFKQKD